MNRHWIKLEYPAILELLATYTDFSAGRELALGLMPAPEYHEARDRLVLTREARSFLDARPDFALGGISDIRPFAKQAERGGTLLPSDLLAVRATLQGGARVRRILTRLDIQFPGLADIAFRIHALPEVSEAIGGVLDERGEVRDNASPELSRIRRELQISLERVQARLRRMLTSAELAPFLQESLITQREGRFVVPIKTDFKGQVHGIVHDRSSSGVTLFIEPAPVVELNNTIREMRLAEEEEIFKLLSELSGRIAGVADEIVATVEALAELDLTLAKARYAYAIDATEPELIPIPNMPQASKDGNLHPGTVLRLKGARHPLINPEEVVPVNLVMDEDTHVLVITGPNTGGKTVCLKTVGLLTLMAKAGLHIPVDPGSAISFFDPIYADIGDEQSIEQSLSTFSSHLTNILSFISEVDHWALVALDELGAGTDPAEGSALARALLEALRDSRSTVLVATHYPELKLYAHNTPGVQNASMEFDAETLSPTFRLSVGLPGRSNAFAIARRLGMPESIVKRAQGMVSGEELRAEDMLADLHSLRIQAARFRDEAYASRGEVEATARALRQRLENIEQERAEILQNAEHEALESKAALQEELDALRRRMRRIPVGQAHANLDDIEAEMATITAAMPELEPLVTPSAVEEEAEPEEKAVSIREGDTVRLTSIGGRRGSLISLEDDEAVVQVGTLRMRVDFDDLEFVHRGGPTKPETEKVSLPPRAASPGIQIDLRGHTVAEALDRLDHYLDNATMAALPWVRIVHGKGTGRLREEIRRFLGDHPLVSSYESAAQKEGGAGATVVHLVTSH